jgi:hypothetical protein
MGIDRPQDWSKIELHATPIFLVSKEAGLPAPFEFLRSGTALFGAPN